MRWMRWLFWWKNPDVERDQRERDAKVAEFSRSVRASARSADRLAEEVRRMQGALRDK